MTKGTFWLENKPDGGISIGIEDYDVEAFNGCDYEWIYTLDRVNKEKFIAILLKTLCEDRTNATEKPYTASLEAMIEAEFGIHLDKKSIMLWFEENDIQYDFCSWVHSKMSRTHDMVRRGK